ncbi:MAG TPA: hypothetical protein EYG92_05180 [Lutibacter sp.]|nr:hypothetical protein [Lutibacter sp.]
MEIVLQLHSYWAYLTLAVLLATVVSSILSFFSKNNFYQKDVRLALFALIAMHIQLLLGLAWYFMSPAYKHLKEIGMGAAMKDSLTRLITVEHPLMMIIAIVLVTIGFSKHKKKESASDKFKTISIYYGIALLFVLTRIPWTQWFE